MVVVGQGYVGLPVAMSAIDAGMHVVGFDVDEAKIAALLGKKSYIDDVSDEDLVRAFATGRYAVSSSNDALHDFDVAVITVPTPLRAGVPDLSHIESAAHLIAPRIRSGSTVILESTTYPGTTDELLVPILESESGLAAGHDFFVGFSPERIDPGNRVFTFRNTPKVVSGINEASLKSVKWFYDQIVETTVPVKGTREAELTKLLENTFRHVNIALVNELAMHARALNVDIWDAIRAASTKPFGFMPFYPGPGVGGHCLPIDPSYLSWKVNQLTGDQFRFVEAANDINSHMPRYVAQRVLLGLNKRGIPLHGARVLVLGVAYKKNSSDARETPATGVIESLLDLGAHVHVHDTHVRHIQANVAYCDLTADELSLADAVVLLTNHDDIDYELVMQNAKYVFDTRHELAGATVEYL